MSCILELPLVVGPAYPSRTVFIDLTGDFSVEEISSVPKPTCLLTTRVGAWFIDGSAEKVAALIASVKGHESVRVGRMRSDGEQEVGHRRVVHGDEPSLGA